MNVEPFLSALPVERKPAFIPVRVDLTLVVHLELNLRERPRRRAAQDVSGLRVENAPMA
jgi:hypothetical protein